MLRLLGFFVGVILLLQLLQLLPGIGWLFHGLIGFWLAAILLSAILARVAARLTARQRLRARLRELGTVDSPHMQGKLGVLLLAHGYRTKALEPLEAAVAAEPEVPEWRYRLGVALLELGRTEEARPHLEAVAVSDEEFAYGGVQLHLAEAVTELRDGERALGALATFDRNHGPNAESVFRRGKALASLGRRDEAKAAYREVEEVAREAVKFKKASQREWVARARLAAWFGG